MDPSESARARTPTRRRVLQALLGLAPPALSGCAGGAAGARPPPLPAGLREGAQRPWLLPDHLAAADGGAPAYRRMQVAVPHAYAMSREPWPLLVFLHGAGERGTDIEDVKRCGPPLLAEQGVAFPMLVCSPQADPGTRWQPERLHALVSVLAQQFSIDPGRVLATGLSLGGSGAWRWACEYPQDLAAIAPICGSCDAAAVAAMRDVPVRAYHGDQDPLVPLARQQACVAELQRQGGSASLTIFPGVGHDSWTPAYADPALVPWLLRQRRA